MSTLAQPLEQTLTDVADAIGFARTKVDPHIEDVVGAIDSLTDGKLAIILAFIKSERPNSTLTLESFKEILQGVKTYAMKEHTLVQSGDAEKIETAIRDKADDFFIKWIEKIWF